jgi:hypothetical protein
VEWHGYGSEIETSFHLKPGTLLIDSPTVFQEMDRARLGGAMLNSWVGVVQKSKRKGEVAL